MIPATSYETQVAERFDALASRFKTSVPASDERLGAILSQIGSLRGMRVLDLGCGKGRFASRLQAMGAEVVGTDVARAMLRVAEGLPRTLASALRLPFRAASFDLVIAIEMFQHLPPGSIPRVLREIQGVLRTGGHVAILDRNPGALHPRRPWLPSLLLKTVDERRGRWMYPSGSPLRERWYRPSVLAARLARQFEDVSVTYPLTQNEARRLIFRAVPQVRSYVLWTGRARGDGA